MNLSHADLADLAEFAARKECLQLVGTAADAV